MSDIEIYLLASLVALMVVAFLVVILKLMATTKYLLEEVRDLTAELNYEKCMTDWLVTKYVNSVDASRG
jgi:hypothetical protein